METIKITNASDGVLYESSDMTFIRTNSFVNFDEVEFKLYTLTLQDLTDLINESFSIVKLYVNNELIRTGELKYVEQLSTSLLHTDHHGVIFCMGG